MPDAPVQKRKWSWKKKLLIFVIMPLLVLVLAGSIFDVVAGTRLRAAMREARQDGGPLTYEELEAARKVWPEAENGARIIEALKPQLEALEDNEALQAVPPFSHNPALQMGCKWPPDILDAAEAELERFKPELEAIDRLREFKGGRFPFTVDAIPAQTMLRDLRPLRTAAKLKVVQAQCRAMHGDTSKLVDTVTILRIQGQLVADEPAMISALVRMAIESLTVEIIQQTLGLTTLTVEQMRQLDVFLAGLEDGDRLLWGARGERACFIASVDYVRANGASVIPRGASWVPGVRGFISQDETVGLRLHNRIVSAAQDPIRSRKEISDVSDELGELPAYRPLCRILMPAITRSFAVNCNLEATVRAARAGLSVERYRLDTGHFPKSLNELVPKYLPGVPLDPWDDKPLRYRSDEYGVVIYSIGDDLKDGGGMVESRRPKGKVERDWGFALLPPGLRSRPATQPVEDEETPEEKAERLRRFREGTHRPGSQPAGQ